MSGCQEYERSALVRPLTSFGCPFSPLTKSVLVTQLERELASTVSALKDERKERRDQTEMLKRKLDKATGTLGDREAELERYERMFCRRFSVQQRQCYEIQFRCSEVWGWDRRWRQGIMLRATAQRFRDGVWDAFVLRRFLDNCLVSRPVGRQGSSLAREYRYPNGTERLSSGGPRAVVLLVE